MEFYSTDVGGLSLKVRKTEAGWEASIAGPASLMNLETAQRAAGEHGLSHVGAGSQQHRLETRMN